MFGTLGWQELLIILVFIGAPTGLIIGLALGEYRPDGPVEKMYKGGELRTASPRRRLAAYLLDVLISLITLGIGWLIWFIVIALRGQTPGKQLVNVYILRDDGTRAGGAYVWLRELGLKGLLFGIPSWFTFYVPYVLGALWCVWDRDRQCLWDKVGSTLIAYSPEGFQPRTRSEVSLAGGQLVPADLGTVSTKLAEARRVESPVPEALRDLRRLRDEGILTDEEYEERRQRLVERL